MRLRIGDHDVEGSPDEVARLLKLLQRDAPVEERRHLAPNTAGPQDASPFVSEAAAYDVLTRRSLADSYKVMFRKLDMAESAWTPAPELQKVLGLNTRGFAGLLGAFGRRISHTPGTGSRAFFDQYWDEENGYNLYRLPPSVRAALRKAKLV